jgi:hypothetical protein
MTYRWNPLVVCSVCGTVQRGRPFGRGSFIIRAHSDGTGFGCKGSRTAGHRLADDVKVSA